MMKIYKVIIYETFKTEVSLRAASHAKAIKNAERENAEGKYDFVGRRFFRAKIKARAMKKRECPPPAHRQNTPQ